MIKIISFKICPFVQRVTALLTAKNISFEVEYISLSDKPQWFLDISPNGQVPLLITESGTPLFESDAIAEYLDEAYKPLEDNITPEERAVDRAWSYLATKNYLTQCSAQRSSDKTTLQERSAKLNAAFAKIEKVLGKGSFFKGDHLSNVDIAWVVLLHRAHLIEKHTGYDFIADFPKIKKWQNSLMKLELVNKSIAGDFEKAFTNFYLSAETFLGRSPEQTNDSCAESCC